MSRRTPAIEAGETRRQLKNFFNPPAMPPRDLAPWVKPDTYEFRSLTTRRETREERIEGNIECGVANFPF